MSKVNKVLDSFRLCERITEHEIFKDMNYKTVMTIAKHIDGQLGILKVAIEEAGEIE